MKAARVRGRLLEKKNFVMSLIPCKSVPVRMARSRGCLASSSHRELKNIAPIPGPEKLLERKICYSLIFPSFSLFFIIVHVLFRVSPALSLSLSLSFSFLFVITYLGPNCMLIPPVRLSSKVGVMWGASSSIQIFEDGSPNKNRFRDAPVSLSNILSATMGARVPEERKCELARYTAVRE